MPNALVILANGFEEIEAIAVIDILRRGQVDVTIAGLDTLRIVSSRRLAIETETVLAHCLTTTYDVIVLPGGEPGTTHLEASDLVQEIVSKQVKLGGWVAAICAAPRILAKRGFLNQKKATSFPQTKPAMAGCLYQEETVVIDKPFITSRGAGTALSFGFEILSILTSEDTAKTVKTAMVFESSF